MKTSRLNVCKVGSLSLAISLAIFSRESAHAQSVEATSSGDWEDPATWSDGQPAGPGNAYRIGDGFTVNSPPVTGLGDYAFTFLGDSLTVGNGGTLELRSISPNQVATATYTVQGLTFENNSSLYLSANTGNIYRTMIAPVAFASGDVTIFNNFTTYSNNLAFDTTASISGSANIHVNLNVGGLTGLERNAIIVNSANNSFSGDWILTSTGAGGGIRYGTLVAGAQNALGTGNVFLDGSMLVNRVEGGLDSLQSVSVGQSSFINVDASWTNPSAAVSLLTNTSMMAITGPSSVSIGALNGVAGSIISGDDPQQSLSVTSTATDQFDGAIIGPLELIKAGPGTLTLGGANTYSGATQVLAGRLNVNGIQSAATGITSVSGGATLGGSGVIGGDVTLADAARLSPGSSPGTLTINGNLTASQGSVFDYELGQAGTVGGALNDLLTVGGDLTLDGVLDIQASAGGVFGPGLYRLINYGGALTDQGLEFGTIPGGSFYIQTSIAGQVNLINSTGMTLNYWDGATVGSKNSGSIEGGDGLWQAAAGNDNWTDASGSLNAPFADGLVAIFGGAPGVVTVDASQGTVQAAGLQFLVDGYSLGGDALTLVGASAPVQVGTAMTATIANSLTGTAQLEKTGAGTLLLTAGNSYSGGTSIQQGVLQISSDSQLGMAGTSLAFNGGQLRTTETIDTDRAVLLNGTGSFEVLADTTYTVNGLISGPGALVKGGEGTMILSADNTYAGGISLSAGQLLINGDQSAGTGSNLVFSAGTLGGTGILGGDVSLIGGHLSPGPSSGIGTLTVNGNLLAIAPSVFDYQFGQANTVGGPLNDLLVVGGNLTLDGVLNVQITPGGLFAPGLYRLINYGGELDDRGLEFGTTPGGSLYIQASVPGQVNLINSTGLTLNFWDGAAVANKNNAAIDGGDGAWQVSAGNDNWTDLNGSLNAPFANGSGAVFSGNPGLVTIDNSLGAVETSFVQFTVDGYTINGDPLTLVNPEVIVRVGDGTAASTATTATIASSITGSAKLIKSDEGTLVLTGNNTYSGGTSVVGGGVLQISSDSQLGLAGTGLTLTSGTLRVTQTTESDRPVLLDGIGALIDVLPAATYTVAGDISGPAHLVKIGGGTLTLSGVNTYGGILAVFGGRLLVDGDHSGATNLTQVANGATLGGSGVIGGDVTLADGARLAPGSSPGTLTINGSLTGSQGSVFDYELGQAGTVGGPLNDLLVVGGDLTLDGVLDIQTAAGGVFAPGLYRLINYGGSLTDQGLEFGVTPGGSLYIQTSIAGQVNLINTTGMTLNYWDGATVASKNSGSIEGGDGLWQAAAGNDNWTDASGSLNAPFADGLVAIFSGAPGAVTVDASEGAVQAAGLQFRVDGYSLGGDALTLLGPSASIQVGDGTAAGATMTATIANTIGGSAQLLKTDLGTLVLTGSNSYSGGTSVLGGVLQISSDAQLGMAGTSLLLNGGTLRATQSFDSPRPLTLEGIGGTIEVTAGNLYSLSGVVSGAGGLRKADAGTLTLTAANSYTGATDVFAGRLNIEGDQSGATGTTSVSSGASLGGSGVLGGNLVLADNALLSPGTTVGTLTVNGDLIASQGSVFDYELGQAGTVGGSLNDLLVVGGNLTLDGVLNVQTTPGGLFAPGVYRLISYGGQFTNQELELGAVPASEVFVQTSIPGQVNLINSTGLTLNFWDGAAAANKNNGTIDGGDGIWQASSGNDNWTESTGGLNAPYSDGAFAVFGGSPGAVTLDASRGDIQASGLQFLVSGYSLSGAPLTLLGPTAYVRVGDGTGASAQMTATIASAITGTAQLIKTDPGTLILSGSNSYAGGTSVLAGVLQISSDTQLGAAGTSLWLNGSTLRTTQSFQSDRSVVLDGVGGTFEVASGTTYSLAGGVAGSGGLWKTGLGSLNLLSAVQAPGELRIVQGTLITGAAEVLNAQSIHTIESAGTLDLASHDQAVGALINAGLISWGNTPGTLLSVGADYVGQGGRLIINTVLGDDDSPTDQLLVSGDTSGASTITVENRGGLGAQTVEGIKLIDIQGASGGEFSLMGDYRLREEQVLVAGAYGYRLVKNGISSPDDGDWYLRSTLTDDPGEPDPPLYQAGVPLYEAYADVLKNLSSPKTLAQRVGHHRAPFDADEAGQTVHSWLQVASRSGDQVPDRSTTGTTFKDQGWELEAGLDFPLSLKSSGSLVAGVSAHFLDGSANVRSEYGDGRIETTGYGVGGTLTWYASNGTYVDAKLLYSWLDSDLRSSLIEQPLATGNDAQRLGASVEVGTRLPMSDQWTVVPQAQLSYVQVDYDRFEDPFEASVSLDKTEALVPRVGVAMEYTATANASDAPHWSAYTILDLSYDTGAMSQTTVSEVPIIHDQAAFWGRVGGGGHLQWAKRYALDFQVSYAQSLADRSESNSVSGTLNFRASW